MSPTDTPAPDLPTASGDAPLPSRPDGAAPPQAPAPSMRERLAQLVRTLKRAGVWLLAVLCVVLFAWKHFATEALTSEAAEREAALRRQARTAVVDETKSLLALSAEIIADQVLPAMRSGDFGSVRRIFRSTMKHERVQGLSLIRNDGKILVATSTKLEGTSAPMLFRDATTGLAQILFDENDKGVIRAIIPIRNGGDTYGVVVLSWDASHIDTLFNSTTAEHAPAQ